MCKNLRIIGFLFINGIFLLSNIHAAIISIQTDKIGYYLSVSTENKLSQLYFGKRFDKPEEINKILNKEKSSINQRGYDAYSFFGNGNINELALQIVQSDGNMTSDLRYVNHSTINISPDIELTTIQLKDKVYPVNISLKYKVYKSTNIIETWVEISHSQEKSIRLTKISSNLLCLDANSYHLTQFSGEWGDEMHMTEEKLTRGIKSLESKRGVRTTQAENPTFILSKNTPLQEKSGEVIFGALSWSGNFKFSFQVDQFNKLSVVSGANNFNSEYVLEPNKNFVTPTLVLSYSDNGAGEATRNFHKWALDNVIRDGYKERPVILNSWEGAYFTFTEKTLKEMIDGASELGVELFVVDDGWFGNKYPRNNDKMGLGDWQVNTAKLPNGINALLKYTQSKGMKFGIWIEPEMVNPQSELAKKHPNWIIGAESGREPIMLRNQLILDLTNPEVQQHIFNVFDNLLIENPEISYIKWDANSHIQSFGSSYLSDDKQSNFFIDYVRGLYTVYDKLMQKYPNVIVQACSSGGGRVDFGSLKYHHEFWPSDNTDALSRLFIQWGTNYFYPAMTTAAHVSKTPNHQTQRITPLKMRIDMAMTGRMGVELQPKDLDATELKFLKESINIYKQKIRSIVQLGDYYRLVSPYETGREAIMFVKENKSAAVIFAFSHKSHYRYDSFTIKLDGLDKNKNYRLKEINVPNNESPNPTINNQVFNGDFLMSFGININLRYEGESAVFEISEE